SKRDWSSDVCSSDLFSLLLYSTSSFFRVLAIKPTPDNTAKAAAEKIAYCFSSPVAGSKPTLLWSTSVFSRLIELPSSIVPSESRSEERRVGHDFRLL